MEEKTVLVFGTFDLLHKGHEFFLQQASKYGEKLIVVVARDKNVEQLKGQAPQQNENIRLEQVVAIDCVSEARLGNEDWGKRLDILENINPQVICLGYDQQAELPEGLWEVFRIESFFPERYKSSKIRQEQDSQ